MEERNLNLEETPFLQLLAEEGEGSTGEAQPARAGEASPAPEGNGEKPAEDLNAEFDALVKGEGKFREIYGRRMQRAALERTKGMRAAVDRLNSFSGAFEVLAARYGTTADDPALAEKIASDAALLSETAERKGGTASAELELAAMRAQKEQAEALIQHILADQEVQRWQREAETLAEKYPGFQLEEQLADPNFAGLLRSGSVSLEGAYLALNHDRVLEELTRRAEKKAADTVAAGKSRPRENAMGSGAGVTVSRDPMRLSQEEFRKWQDAVARGERVSFAG